MLPQGDEKRRVVRDMFDAIAPRYDLVNRIMTFRLDVRWRRRTVRDLQLPAGARVLDLAAGTGDLCGVTCGFALRNFVDLGGFFTELGRVVRPGGRMALLEVAEPANPLLRAGHGIYFGKVVPRIGALLSDADAYRYLPKSVAYLPEPPAVLGMLRDAGFPDARRALLSGGIAQLLTGTRA
jgi:demethylmenaquinone methyltransferase/2-methoxy-6-polyprenyl-1,4-benzoquinol methylase